MRENLIAGLDIGTTKTCAVIAELVGDGRRRPELKILGVGQAKTSGVRREVVTHIEETTESIQTAVKEAELMAGTTIDRVWAGIGGDHIRTQSSLGVVAVSGEEISAGDLARVHEVARAVALPPDRELLHAIPQEYAVDHQRGIKDPVGMSGVRLEADVYLVTCASSAATNLRKAVSRAGYRVQALVLAPLATARAVLSEDEKEVGVAMIEVGAATTQIASYYEGKIRHFGVLALGGDTVTNDMVKGLSVPFAEAQRAKEKHAAALARLVDPTEVVDLPGPAPAQTRQVPRELISHIVEQRLDELFGLIHQEFEAAGLLDRLGGGVVLTGGTAALNGIVDLATRVFGVSVRIGVPSEGLSGLADSVRRPRFATVTGLCLHGADRFHETGEGASTRSSGMVSRVGSWIREFF